MLLSRYRPNRFLFTILSCAFLLTLPSGKYVPKYPAAITNSVSFQDVSLISPANGATNVSVGTSISWTPTAVVGVVGYKISLGTSPGAGDIANNISVGLSTSYTPPLGLPDNTTIYVNISLFFLNGPDIPCPEQSFTTEVVTTPPPCTQLSGPVDGEIDVPVATNITWNHALSAKDYFITIGTTSGGNDILPRTNVGDVLSYNPPADLPPNTLIYITVVPNNSIGEALSCREESFTTAEASILPGCTFLLSPENGDSGVPISTILTWAPVGNATGYIVTVGSGPLPPLNNDILDNVDVMNTTSISFLNFVPNSFVYVSIVPYNDAGEAIGCIAENFSTILGCGPFTDPDSGEVIFFGPELDFPESIGLCLDELPFVATATPGADGYRWFSIDQFGAELLVSSTETLEIFREGNYRLEAFNLVEEGTLECSVEQAFTVTASEAPTVVSVDIQTTGTGTQVTLVVTGNGDYEYALNDRNGPYQDSPTFDISLTEPNTVFIRDKNGCGLVGRFINDGLPNFFTPNGDSFNDFWQVPGGVLDGEPIVSILIFDRFGKLLVQLDPGSQGWDGNYVGNPMPSTDYWYHIQLESGRIFRGHFALRR